MSHDLATKMTYWKTPIQWERRTLKRVLLFLFLCVKVRMAMKYSDEILLLSSGKLKAFGSPESEEICEIITEEFFY